MTSLGDVRRTIRDLIAKDESIGTSVQERHECLLAVLVKLQDYEIFIRQAFEDLNAASKIDSGDWM